MASRNGTTGDELVQLLGQGANSGPVQASLAMLARGMQPELDADSDDAFVDWVTVNELGLEFGFEDEALVRAMESTRLGRGPLLLSQLYFYGDTADTMPFPFTLPFGLEFSHDRASVRQALSPYEATRRSYIRDAWRLPGYDVTVAYGKTTGCLESVLCHIPWLPWPVTSDERERVATFTPEVLASLFGMRWSSAGLRDRLQDLDYAKALPEVRSEQSANLRMSHGIEFSFAPGQEVPSADPSFPQSLALSAVTYYGARVYDAREWVGPMPFDLAFEDSQAKIARKLGRKPDVRGDLDRVGFALWHFERYSLRAEYSNIENHLLRATILAPGYWDASEAAKEIDT